MNAPIMLQPELIRNEEDRARADHYALLARLFFAAPDAPLLAALVHGSRSLGGEANAFARAWTALGEAAARAEPAAVADEFATLFVSVSKPVVMLNGSWYLTGFLQEEPLAELRDDLAALGLGRRQGVTETEDHIAALAEVMRHLVLTGPDAAGLERQRRFFGSHIAPWYAQMVDSLAAAPGAGFYVEVGSLLRAFLDIEREAFDMF